MPCWNCVKRRRKWWKEIQSLWSCCNLREKKETTVRGWWENITGLVTRDRHFWELWISFRCGWKLDFLLPPTLYYYSSVYYTHNFYAPPTFFGLCANRLYFKKMCVTLSDICRFSMLCNQIYFLCFSYDFLKCLKNKSPTF